ncbi:hypothetical protein KBA73_03955, partial [Patescibacteria group bacterium]|nr:hypothetical protein [Patescibacteria group bacterium]
LGGVMKGVRILWADRSRPAIDRFAQSVQVVLCAEVTQINQSIDGIFFVEMAMHPHTLLIWEVDAILGARLEQTFHQRWPTIPTLLFSQYRNEILALHRPDQRRHALHKASLSPEAFAQAVQEILSPPSSLTPP